VSVWEIIIKKGLGRLELDTEVLERELETGDMNELPVRWRHAKIAGALPKHHQDRFDRMLVAHAQSEGLTLVSYDGAFQPYDVAVLPSVGP
jgi:PIN domain nuclease of toxin-antitoxin system